MADPTIKPGAVISWGISTVIYGGLSSLNDWAISAKPGGGVSSWETGLHGGIFLCWVKIFAAIWHWLEMVFSIDGMMGPLVHSLLLANKKEPWEWALIFWPQLLSHLALGSSGSRALDGVNCTQHGPSTSLNTSASMIVLKRAILSLNLVMYSASW